YELMNIGVIVQNGSFNYHLTSYFYFVAFLQPFTEPHDAFLRQVLNNKYFNLMCGRHSGFGYTFENIFLSALIIYGTKNEEKVNIPLKTSNLRNLEVIKGKIKWSELSLETNFLYHFPEAEAIDAVVIQGEELLLIQITTSNPPNESKIDNLSLEMEDISKIYLKIGNELNVRGWFVSLNFPFTKTSTPL
ncbi:MAG: hypothetical protein ACTSRI_15435, partial [Promethearchaeota archaeon]